jgi:release factor glutamine methyltransferase
MLKTKKLLREKLSSIYAPSETESLISLILEHVTGYKRLQLHLNQSEQLPEPKIMQIMEIVNRLLIHEPIQYIIGETEFYGLKFTVSPAVAASQSRLTKIPAWS